MIGHGSPSSSILLRAQNATLPLRFHRRWQTFVLVAALFSFSHCSLPHVGCAIAADQVTQSTSTRLKLNWGGGNAVAWQGRIWLDHGSISDLRYLGNSADSAGSVWLDEGQIRINSLSKRSNDSIEIVANGDSSAQLFVELIPASNSPKITPTHAVSIPLAELQRRSQQLRLDQTGNMLKIDHVPLPPLEIKINRESLIFAPGEQLVFEMQPNLADLQPGTSLDVEVSLSTARRGGVVWSEPKRLEVPVEDKSSISLTVPMPKEEGAYIVRVAVSRPPGFRPRFFPGTPAPAAEKTFDVVVLDPNPLQQIAAESWESVLELDPTSPGWWERLPAWTNIRRIPGINLRQVGSTRAGTIDLPVGRFVELPGTIVGSEPHWQAYSIPVESVGVPHLLEIEYPASDEQHFSLSVLEPNAAGVVESIGRDGGVYVEGFGRNQEKCVYRTVFWPRTQVPTLLVMNQHASAPAHYGHIRVSRCNVRQLASAPMLRGPGDRLVAAYVARPMLPQTFGATAAIDKLPANISAEQRAVDDWHTIYESAARLSEFVRYSGYNSAVVSVLAEGSTIYPSKQVAPTPKYNIGRRESGSHERDALELLLRVFDRDGLAFVPAMQLASPLPQLEALRRSSNPQSSGIEWVGPNGKTPLEMYGTEQGLGPYYNILNEQVQKTLLDVIRELVTKCESHRSFAGLAIQLSPNGYAQLPPVEWGLDDVTIAQFTQDTGIRIDSSGETRFADRHAALTGPHLEAWRSWRAERLTDFYRKAVQVLRGSDEVGGRRLILTLEDAFNSPELAPRIRPSILSNVTNRIDSTLLDVGIDRTRLNSIPGVVVSATRYVESMSPLADRASDMELNEAFAAWKKPQQSSHLPATLLYHRAHTNRLSSPQIGTLKFSGDLAILSYSSAHATAVRQPYVFSLLQHDPEVLLDGGEMLPLGQSEELYTTREILRQLPTDATVSEFSAQPVTVRTYTAADGVTILAVNASPWQAAVEVTLNAPQATTLRSISSSTSESTSSPISVAAGHYPWKLLLGPYEVCAVRTADSTVEVVEVKTVPSPAAKQELVQRLSQIEACDLVTPRPYIALANPGFEPTNGVATLTGWKLVARNASANLDVTNPCEGASCVHFRNELGAAVLESEPFESPATGQLAMTVLTRGQKMAAGSELRMVIESTHGKQLYRCPRLLPAPKSTDRWYREPILVNDLPLENRGLIRVRFEITGPGEVYLDGVQIYDLLFPLEFYENVEAERLQFAQWRHAAKSAIEEGRIVDGARAMDRYWSRFLLEYTPQIQIEAATPVAAPLAMPPTREERPSTGFNEALRRVLPFRK